jgi:hypothetical protein
MTDEKKRGGARLRRFSAQNDESHAARMTKSTVAIRGASAFSRNVASL